MLELYAELLTQTIPDATTTVYRASSNESIRAVVATSFPVYARNDVSARSVAMAWLKDALDPYDWFAAELEVRLADTPSSVQD